VFGKCITCVSYSLQGLNRSAQIPDATGKMLSAKTVFSLCIKYLKVMAIYLH